MDHFKISVVHMNSDMAVATIASNYFIIVAYTAYTIQETQS